MTQNCLGRVHDLQSLIIQLGVKECILIETPSSKAARLASRPARKTIKSVTGGGDDDDSNAEAGPSTSSRKDKEKAKDDPEVLKLMAMIERCGVMITEVGGANFSNEGVEGEVKRLLQERLATVPLRE